MPKAKRYKRKRLTRQARNPNITHKKEDGRPKGTFKRYSFEQTRLGFFFKYECPVLYEVLMRMIGKYELSYPRVELIALICKNSNDPSLKKAKFKRYLEEYKKYGVYCRKAQKMTPKREIYYERIRKNKLNEYIQNNGIRIVRERKFQ